MKKQLLPFNGPSRAKIWLLYSRKSKASASITPLNALTIRHRNSEREHLVNRIRALSRLGLAHAYALHVMPPKPAPHIRTSSRSGKTPTFPSCIKPKTRMGRFIRPETQPVGLSVDE